MESDARGLQSEGDRQIDRNEPATQPRESGFFFAFKTNSQKKLDLSLDDLSKTATLVSVVQPPTPPNIQPTRAIPAPRRLMPRGENAMRQAASMMAARMRLYKRLAQQAQERGDSSVELNVREMWETGDEEALAAFDAATNILNGAQPLPLEIPA